MNILYGSLYTLYIETGYYAPRHPYVPQELHISCTYRSILLRQVKRTMKPTEQSSVFSIIFWRCAGYLCERGIHEYRITGSPVLISCRGSRTPMTVMILVGTYRDDEVIFSSRMVGWAGTKLL